MARKKGGKKGGFGFTVKTVLPPVPEVKSILGVDADGDVQKYVTEDIFRRLIPYIPKKTGKLRDAAKIKSPRRITVNAAYAKVQFFGVTKQGVPFEYNTVTGGAKAGSHWDRRLIADEGKAIVADANRYVRRRKHGR